VDKPVGASTNAHGMIGLPCRRSEKGVKFEAPSRSANKAGQSLTDRVSSYFYFLIWESTLGAERHQQRDAHRSNLLRFAAPGVSWEAVLTALGREMEKQSAHQTTGQTRRLADGMKQRDRC
jgi:hypothetical protein